MSMRGFLVTTVLFCSSVRGHLCDPMETITLKEVLQRMDAGEAFSIAFITADRKKKGVANM